jgi:crossover junction endodeoxyribonuclease RuvC
MIICAIDPGIEGGIAILDDGMLDVAADLPVAGEGAQRMVSGPLLASIFDLHPHVSLCILERTSAMPGQGVSSMYRFGRAVGTIEGVLSARKIPIRYVTPAVWKKGLGLSPDKEQSRQRAIETWPSHAHLFARKKDHQRAEAALLGLWGLRAAQAAGEVAA